MTTKVKVSELPLSSSYVGLHALGVDSTNTSVKVSLEPLDSIDDKLETTNIKEGTNITVSTSGNDVTINGSDLTPYQPKTDTLLTDFSHDVVTAINRNASNILDKLKVADIIAGDNITLDKVGNDITINADAEDVDLSLDITYADLKALKDASELVAGQQYHITDYKTTVTQTNCQVAPTGEYVDFTIVVKALTTNSFSEDADVPEYPDWEVKYHFDNDNTLYLWTATDGKGTIYYMKDSNNNETPYDSANVQFLNGTEYVNTFGSTNKNIVLKSYYSSGYKLNEVYFGDNCYSNVFGDSSRLNTFSDNCRSNSFGNNCESNAFGSNCSSNTLDSTCYSNTLGEICSSNTLGSSCSSNIFNYNCTLNTFGDSCTSNTFGDTCFSNTFGRRCDFNTFGDFCFSNTFGGNCELNTLGNYCRYNTFSNYCYNNTFEANTQNINLKGQIENIDFTGKLPLNSTIPITVIKDANDNLIMQWYDEKTGILQSKNINDTSDDFQLPILASETEPTNHNVIWAKIVGGLVEGNYKWDGTDWILLGSTVYQTIEDPLLETEAKTIPLAINENKNKVDDTITDVNDVLQVLNGGGVFVLDFATKYADTIARWLSVFPSSYGASVDIENETFTVIGETVTLAEAISTLQGYQNYYSLQGYPGFYSVKNAPTIVILKNSLTDNNLYYSFVGSSGCRVFYSELKFLPSPTNIKNMASYSNMEKILGGFKVGLTDNDSTTSNYTYIDVIFTMDANIKNFNKITFDNLELLLNKSGNGTTTVTWTLHSDVYAKIYDNTNPDYSEWSQLATLATTKNINIATV